MDWSNDDLLDLTYNMRTRKLTKEQITGARAFCKQNAELRCAYCGGAYDKTVYCKFDGDKYIKCCQLCHTIIDFAPHLSKLIILGKSKDNQIDIIRKTADYIIKNNKTPEPYEISKDYKEIKMKPSKFFTDVPHNGKIYYSPEIDISAIILNKTTSDEYSYKSNPTKDELIAYRAKNTMDMLSNWAIKETELTNEILQYIKTSNQLKLLYTK